MKRNSKEVVLEREVLMYGEVLTDDEFYVDENKYIGSFAEYVRIRTVKYNGHIYFHKMADGTTEEFKELM